MKIKLKKLSEQVVVLTGASSGIGLTTARKAAKQGAKLVLVARNEEALAEVTTELTAQGAEVIFVAADVGNEDDMRNVAERAVERFGRIDTWVNNAGVGLFGKNEEVSTEDKRRIFETNFWGVVYGSMVAVPHLKTGGGALINIGSAFSDRAAPLQGIYSASKHAVKGFTDSLRMELEEEGAPISVTLIKPAAIDSMYVQHAKNYMEVEPTLPPPVYAPDTVADAILYAAENPKRDIYVGSAAKLLALGENLAPGLMDKFMEKLMFKLQKTELPPQTPKPGNLHQPIGDSRERGGSSSWPVFERSWTTAAVTHPKTSTLVLIAGGLALAALLHRQRGGDGH